MSKGDIFIGNKPIFNYVNAVVYQLNTLNKEEVIIKARGKYTSKAIDVAEIVKKNNENFKVNKIDINSSNFKNDHGKDTSVSEILISIQK